MIAEAQMFESGTKARRLMEQGRLAQGQKREWHGGSGIPCGLFTVQAMILHYDHERLRTQRLEAAVAELLSLREQGCPTSMPGKKIDFDLVRKIALTLPGVEESSLHGAPSLKVSGRLLTCPAIHRSAKPNSLLVRIGFDQRAELMAAEPSIYYVTAHYMNYPAVLVRLDQIDRSSLRDLLRLAWCFVSSKTKARIRP